MDLINSMAQAIATMEGFFKPNTIAQRNNNPGNLRSWGSNPIRNGYAVFATPEEGWAALRKQIQLNINRGLTLSEFFGGKAGVYAGYAPSADSNDPVNYARFVAGRVGIPVDQPISGSVSGSAARPPAASRPVGPSWADLPEDGWASNEMLIYGAIAMLALAAVWTFTA
jgi:hypothetical protein